MFGKHADILGLLTLFALFTLFVLFVLFALFLFTFLPGKFDRGAISGAPLEAAFVITFKAVFTEARTFLLVLAAALRILWRHCPALARYLFLLF